jgi:hypothetical protein
VWSTDLRRERGRKGAHQSCPLWWLAADGETAVEARTEVVGAGDWVGELRGAAPELGDGSAGGLEGPGQCYTVVSQWRHDGAVGGGVWRRKKGSLTGIGLPL